MLFLGGILIVISTLYTNIKISIILMIIGCFFINLFILTINYIQVLLNNNNKFFLKYSKLIVICLLMVILLLYIIHEIYFKNEILLIFKISLLINFMIVFFIDGASDILKLQGLRS